MSDRPVTTWIDDDVPQTVVAHHELPLIGSRYRVVGMLGGGGMGNVYLAHDTELDEHVAVKVLKPALSRRREQLELLRREVKLARRVTHPNVVRTFDIGDHAGSKFVTMELVEGGTLSALLPNRMPLTEVERIAHAVCAGLGAAHDAGIVHYDLKPSNVLLANDGRILLSDFGIARLASESDDGSIAGTPGYIAPERLACEPFDARADVYALGVMLFEMLCGRRPYLYASRDDMYHPPLEAAPDPRDLRPEIPLALARVITRCMARAPDARFSHPREIAAAIANALPAPSQSAAGSVPRLAAAAVRRVRVLAVMPLANLGPPEDAHLAEGLTALLIAGLDSAQLRVPSRGAVEAARPGDRDALEVGRDLGAEAIVTGSVERSASGSVTVVVRVIGTGDGLVLFADTVLRPVAELVRAAEDASRAIARSLLVERKDASAVVHESEVIDLYLQGLHEFRRRWDEALARSVDCFRRALDRAPDDAMILSAYAIAVTRRLTFVRGEEPIAQARQASQRALLLARERPEPHLAVAALALQLGEHDDAARSLRVALAIAPHLADAHSMRGLLGLEVNSVADGLAHLYTATTLDPAMRHVRWWIARAHALLGEWSRCDALFDALPDDAQAQHDYWMNRARALVYNVTPERVQRFADDLERSPEFSSKTAVASILALARGERGPAATAAAAKLTLPPDATARQTCYISSLKAELACFMGEPDQALAALRDAERAQLIDLVWLDACPLLAPLRDRADLRSIREVVAARAASVSAILAAPSG
ncbi:MAG: protein kinase [Labilithrix sp.]|nr:protein kinase [Labilithrix sp.]